jgi:hypothetical protein
MTFGPVPLTDTGTLPGFPAKLASVAITACAHLAASARAPVRHLERRPARRCADPLRRTGSSAAWRRTARRTAFAPISATYAASAPGGTGTILSAALTLRAHDVGSPPPCLRRLLGAPV